MACVHGEVCRAYLEKFRGIKIGRGFTAFRTPCILSLTCPNGCRFYEEKKPEGLHFKGRS